MSVISESFSDRFGVGDVNIEQSLYKSYDIYSAIDLDKTEPFLNSQQSLQTLNRDKELN